VGGGRGHIAQVKKLVPFRSFMLLAAVLFLSWIGAWVSQNPGSEVQLHCKCTGTTETVICPPVWILVGGIDQSLESFVFLIGAGHLFWKLIHHISATSPPKRLKSLNFWNERRRHLHRSDCPGLQLASQTRERWHSSSWIF